MLHYLLPFFLLAGFTSSSTFISDDVFESHGSSSGRSLLQAKKICSLDFENMNYTIITSKCKGPRYEPNLCCDSFKEFACPYAEELNDMTNDCATTMFSYINIYGKYPPGLFANECRGDKEGLACPEESVSNKDSVTPSRGIMVTSRSFLLMIVSGFAVFLYCLF